MESFSRLIVSSFPDRPLLGIVHDPLHHALPADAYKRNKAQTGNATPTGRVDRREREECWAYNSQTRQRKNPYLPFSSLKFAGSCMLTAQGTTEKSLPMTK